MVYLLHGEDEFGIAQLVSELEARLGDASTVAMNMARLDGRSASLEDIRLAALAIPFLSDRRLVVLYHPLAKLSTAALQEKFRTLLDGLPQTTRLVLVEYKTLIEAQRGKPPKKHWLLEWAEAAGSHAYIKGFPIQKGAALARWIQEQAKLSGGTFTREAAEALSNMVGEDTRLAHAEIQKLLAYANYSRPVQPEDVEILTSFAGETDIFAMVDALGSQDGRNAMRLLHRLLDEQDPQSIFGMVVRQFRLLLLARDILDRGGDETEVARELKIHPFVAKKITPQARRFSLASLEAAYRRLLDMDEAMKTGQVESDVALDTFVAAFAA